MKKIWEPKLDGRKWSQTKIINELLKIRQIDSLDKFLYPVEEDMLPFDSLKNIQAAANVVIDGIKNGNSFFIYADTDVDGLSSGAIIYNYLKNINNSINIISYVNNGKAHGLQQNAPCFDKKYDIVIIVDSIETDTFLYSKLINEMGSKIVVLDHHDLVGEILEVQESINLVSSMNEYDNPNLCGAGVTLKFCLYLDSILGTDYANNYYDLAACGICADMMDVGVNSFENRFICDKGFHSLTNKGLKKIIGNYEMNSTAVSFSVAPIINAANRMNHNQEALNLFLSNDDTEISELIDKLKGYRVEQGKRVDALYQEVEKQAQSQINSKVMFFTLEDSDNLSGLLANKALGEYQRPIIIVQEFEDESTGEKVLSGSLRATGVDNFAQLVNKTRYAKAMGHSSAAGFKVLAKNKEKFLAKINSKLEGIEFAEKVCADIQLTQRQINKDIIKWLKQINRISGQGFEPITVLIEDVNEYEVGNMASGKHTKIITPYMLFIKWNSTDWETIPDDKTMSAVGTLDQNYFGKKLYYQMIVQDYKFEDKIDIDI